MKHTRETIEKRKAKWQSFIKKEITNRELKKEKEKENDIRTEERDC